MLEFYTNRLFLCETESNKSEMQEFIVDNCDHNLSTNNIINNYCGEEDNLISSKNILKVRLKNSKKLIGYIFLYEKKPLNNKTYIIQFAFDKKFLFRCYEGEALKIIINHVFMNLDGHRIISSCSVDDSVTWKTLERLSFREEGILVKSQAFIDSSGSTIWQDELIYALLKEEFEEFQQYNISSLR